MTYNIYLITLSQNSKHAQFFTLKSDIMGWQGVSVNKSFLGDRSLALEQEAHMPRALAGVREILPQKHDGMQSWFPKLSSDLHMCVEAQEHIHEINPKKDTEILQILLFQFLILTHVSLTSGYGLEAQCIMLCLVTIVLTARELPL